MLISFWNCAGNRSGVTTNAAGLALFYALRYRKRVALFENHLPSGRGLYEVLTGKRRGDFVFEEPIYYGKNHRFHDIYRQIKSGFPIHNMSDSAIKLAQDRLHYYPQDDYGCHDLLDYELNKIIEPFLDSLDLRYELIFVDLKQYNTMTTKKIIQRSDLIFLNLLAEEENLELFFDRYAFEKNRYYFIFNKSFEKIDDFKQRIVTSYPLDEARFSILPYNENFDRVCKNGNLENFLQKHKWDTLGQKTFPFMYEYRKMTAFIKKALEGVEEEEKA